MSIPNINSAGSDEVIAVTPVIGEFGYIIFDIQPRVRAWLRRQNAKRKVVFAPKSMASLFEQATEIIECPAELLPTAPATMRSIVYEHWTPGDPERTRIERLVDWAKSHVQADRWLEIPYFEGRQWESPATFTRLESDLEVPSDPYIVISARARAFDGWRNWSQGNWDELVSRVKDRWGLEVRCIGKPPDTYYPKNAVPQGVDEVRRLDHSIALLNHAVCSISSNSGPTHLSLMAGCPTFTWGEPYLKSFMEQYTNPLGTLCCCQPVGWDPHVDVIWKALCDWQKQLEHTGRWQLARSTQVKVSMCMIARDSSRTIRPALESIRPWVDEMVVVDTGSDDDTAKIAEECGARVAHFPWCDDFAAARNESLRYARGQWILWMDSDDTIDAVNGAKLRKQLEKLPKPSVMGFVMQVHCPPNEDSTGYHSKTVVDHVKLFRNIPSIRFSGRIHEQVLLSIRKLGGDVEWSDVAVLHSGSDTSAEGRRRKHVRDLHLLELELADNPDSTFTLFNIGMTLVDKGDYEQALGPLCRSLQMASPGESHIRKIYALLVQAYGALNRSRSAYVTCLQGLSVCPGDPELLFRRGALAHASGRLEEARQAFEKILNDRPDQHFTSIDLGIMGAKTWHNLAIVYEQQGNTELAMNAWRQVVTCEPENRNGWRCLLVCQRMTNDVTFLKEWLKDAPQIESLADLRLIAESRLVADSHGLLPAIQMLESEMAKRTGSIDVLEELCRVCFDASQLTRTQRWLTELVQRNPNDAAAVQNLGVAHIRCGNYNSAIEALRASLKIRPDHPPAIRLLEQACQLANGAGGMHPISSLNRETKSGL